MLEKNKVYNLSEFCRVLRESQQSKQEFKAKKGENVDNEDKKNNGKAVKNDINNIVDSLKPNEAKIIRMRFGLTKVLYFSCYVI